MCSHTSLRVIRVALNTGNFNYDSYPVELDTDREYYMPRNMTMPKWVIDRIDDRTVKLYVRNADASALCEAFTLTDGKAVTSVDGFFVSRLLEQRVRRFMSINMVVFAKVYARDTKYKKPLVGYVRKVKTFNTESMLNGSYTDTN